MAVPVNKEELILAINTNYKKLKKELENIPIELTTLKDLEGHSKGTLMSINNLLSYLLGWQELVLKWNVKKQNKEKINFPETGYKWNQLGKLAETFYEDYKNDDFIMLAKNYETILKPDQIIELFEKLSVELEDATPAYLHVLFEYEMIDKAREVLANTKNGEFSPFKALLDLKEAGKHYNLEAISYK